MSLIHEMMRFGKFFGGGSANSFSERQINALDALFKAASYIKDASAEYAAFCDAFGIVNPDEPSEPDVVVPSVKQGTVSFENGKMNLNGTMAARATLIPIGQYLKNGASYKFSLGDAASTYVYGIQIFVADSPTLKFPHAYETISYDGVTERLVDTGWTDAPCGYSVTKDNCILTVNFRKKDHSNMAESDYAVLFESFKIEEILPTDDDIAPSVKKGNIVYQNNSIALQPDYDTRATLVPLGRYLTKGKTYRFSLGSVADKYRYGVSIYTAQAEGLIFPYVAGKTSIYIPITPRIVDSGWLGTDYTYTPDTDNCVVTVNFKGNPEVALNDSNYDEIFENFVIEEIA